MTRIDRRAGLGRAAGLTLAALALATTACSGSAAVAERNANAADQAEPASPQPAKVATQDAQGLHPTGAPAPAPKRSDKFAVSKVLGKKDEKMVDGKTTCYVDFVYAGEEPQQMTWDEPCAKVTAGMIGRPKLEALGWWEKLDSFQRGFVEKMPGGQALFIEGEFSAAIYPEDETGTATEIEVAD